MDAPSIHDFRRRLAEAGWREIGAEEGSGFGSWSIELEWGLRVGYDGKDDGWGCIGKRVGTTGELSGALYGADQTPAGLLTAMRSAASDS
jgi:hypothetical protein